MSIMSDPNTIHI